MFVIKDILFLFSKMQETGSFDTGSVIDLYSLHFVVLPLLRKAIDSFITGWNNHKMRTKKSKSPRQLFIQGICQLTWDGQPHAELNQVYMLRDIFNFYYV